MVTGRFDWAEWLPHTTVSHVGMRRENNQDAYLVQLASDLEQWRIRGHLFIVADGMGAHAAGELASRMAADTLSHAYSKLSGSPPQALLNAVRYANETIHQRGQMNAEFHNMGTTCSSLLLLPQGAMIAHVGDSRVYRLRQGFLEQLTFDHSLQWEMREVAKSAGQETIAGIPKNVITRSLGPKAQVQVDLEGPFPLRVGDTFLLCSDGLTGQIEDEELAGILEYLDLEDAAECLVALANLRGGPDNITAIIVRVADAGLLRAGARAGPLYVGEAESPRKKMHPGLWIGLGTSFLLGAGMAIAGQPTLAGVALVAAVICLGVIFVQAVSPSMSRRLLGKQRWGKGPYRRAPIPECHDFAVKLRASLGQGAGDKSVELQRLAERLEQLVCKFPCSEPEGEAKPA